jgi:hypothetical protein
VSTRAVAGVKVTLAKGLGRLTPPADKLDEVCVFSEGRSDGSPKCTAGSGAVAIGRSSEHGRVRYLGSEVWGGTWPVALRAQ